MKKLILFSFLAACELLNCGLSIGSRSAMGQDNSKNSDERSSTMKPIGLWDPIPRSPSTTPAIKIQDGYWRGQFERVNREVAAGKKTQVVFFGDSITLNWSHEGASGKDVWKEYFSKYHPINMGNSGDITPVMLYRVSHGNLAFPDGRHPKVAVLLCGTNNFVVTQSAGGKVTWDLGPKCPPEDVAHAVRAIAQEFRRRLPQTRVIIMGLLPVANESKRAMCQQVNLHLEKFDFDDKEVLFVDLSEKFVNPDGTLNEKLFSDGTHLTTKGYHVWAEGVAPRIKDSIKKSNEP